MVGFARLGECIAVERKHPELVTIERQVEIGIGADIADLPDLETAWDCSEGSTQNAVYGLGFRRVVIGAGKLQIPSERECAAWLRRASDSGSR